MVDDAERAAKAARAKAMLKKRQQQKVGTSPSPSPAPGANHAPSSRAASPAARSPDHKDASLLFGPLDQAVVEFGEFGALTPSRVLISPPPGSPPPPPHPPPLSLELTAASTNSGTTDTASNELHMLVSNQQKTISLLVNDKASLVAQLETLEDLQTKSSASEGMLEEERRRSKGLADRLQQAEEQVKTAAKRLDEAQNREREAHEKSRDQGREFDLIKRTAEELRTQLENSDLQLRTLKEQVEADDRVETLERSLNATQDRTEELEFQLTKVKQNHSSCIQERDDLAREVSLSTSREAEWTQRRTMLEQQLTSAQHEITVLSSSLKDTERARVRLENQLTSNEMSLAAVQQELALVSSELASQTRQLYVAQAEVDSAQRRAENAEQAQRSLQSENSGLLMQLEEVRPKVVELSNRNAEAEERIWDAEREVHVLETNVATLETKLAERVTSEEETKVRLEGMEREKQREEETHRIELREIRDAYAFVTRELELAKTHGMKLEEEKAEHHAAISAKDHHVDRWKAEAESRAAELAAAMGKLSAQRQREDETLAIVDCTQAEIESLRDQLALREDELMRLREDAPSLSSTSSPKFPDRDRKQSLNEEILGTVRQQHALDLSTAHSRIRLLETELFEAQAATHTFQGRVAALENEITHLRSPVSIDVPGRRSTPPFPRSSTFHGGSEDSRRHSLSSTRSHTPSSLRPVIVPRAVYEDNLSAATRHKRKVSLSMLKARIESERAAALQSASPLPLVSAIGSPRLSVTRGLSNAAIAEVDESRDLTGDGEQTPQTCSDDRTRSVDSDSYSHSRPPSGRLVEKEQRAPQFLDESHVFWCHSCRGDLVVL